MNPLVSRRRLLGTLAVTSAASVVLTACGGGGSGQDGQPVRAFGLEPERPLIPTDTVNEGGLNVVDLVFKGLVVYDQDGAPVNELAESIDSDDSTTWRITIKGGKAFTNGEEITAQSFVDAWNYGAAAVNAQQASYFFEPILGYDEVSAEDSEVTEMKGLRVIDDTTFEVELTGPNVTFPARLGYCAFAPLPASAFEDMEAFGEHPVGWGPFEMDGEDAWAHDQEIRLVRNEDYDGQQPAQIEALTFQIYQDAGAAYTDLISENLDLAGIPTDQLEVADDDLPGRIIEREIAAISGFALPYYLPEWSGEAGKLRRRAISKALNRQELIDAVLHGEGTPAKEFTAPSLDGYPESLKGSENFEFDAEAARQLWARAEEIDPWETDKPFELAYNTDGGNKDWVDAVCHQIANALGITAQGKSYATFKELRSEVDAGELTSPVRISWFGDYPSMHNFLGPMYAKGGSMNDSRYDNPDFNRLLDEGLAAPTVEEANAKFVEADEMLLEDLPSIMLWYSKAKRGRSDRVADVELTWNGRTDYSALTQA